MRMIYVVAGAVGQHGVDQMGLHLGGHGAFSGKPPGVIARALILEVPTDFALKLRHVGVYEHRGGCDRVGVRSADRADAELGLDTAHLLDGHEAPLPRRAAQVGHGSWSTQKWGVTRP